MPNASSVRRQIPNRDKDFFDRLIENEPCTSWSRKLLPLPPKNERRFKYEEYYDDDFWYDNNEDGSLWDGVIWSGNSPSRFFVGINVVM